MYYYIKLEGILFVIEIILGFWYDDLLLRAVISIFFIILA